MKIFILFSKKILAKKSNTNRARGSWTYIGLILKHGQKNFGRNF